MTQNWTNRLRRWAGPASIVAASAIMCAATWRKWPDPLIDFGIQLYTPWQLSQGKVLYRDVASLYGPLSDYVNATLFRMFGASLTVVIWTNLGLFLLLLAMLYRIAAATAGRIAATVGCLLVVFMCGFSQYTPAGNYNFVCPYTNESTYGMVLAMGVMYAWWRFGRMGTLRWAAVAGLCTGLAALTKPEASLAAAVAAGAGWLAMAVSHPARQRAAGRALALLLGMAVLPLLLAAGAFATVMPPAKACAAALTAWKSALNPALRGNPAYREWMGTANFSQHLGEMGFASGCYLLAIAGACLIAWVIGRCPARARGWLAAAVAALMLACLCTRLEFFFTFGVVRPLPLILAALAAAGAVWLWRKKQTAGEVFRMGWLLTLFAAVYLLRIEFNARVWHFGFVLTVPALMCLAAGFLSWIPRWMSRFRWFSPMGFQVVAGALLTLIVAGHLLIASRYYALKTTRVTGVEPGDWFWADLHGVYVNRVVEMLDANLGPRQTVSVFPQGVMINYLARRAAPNRFIDLEPPNWPAFGVATINEAFERQPPDAVVLVHRDSSGFGVGYFGEGYAQELWAFLHQNYAPVGPPLGAMPFNEQKLFGMLVLARTVQRPATVAAPISATGSR